MGCCTSKKTDRSYEPLRPWCIQVNTLPAHYCDDLGQLEEYLEEKLAFDPWTPNLLNVEVIVTYKKQQSHTYQWNSFKGSDVDVLMTQIGKDFEDRLSEVV